MSGMLLVRVTVKALGVPSSPIEGRLTAESTNVPTLTAPAPELTRDALATVRRCRPFCPLVERSHAIPLTRAIGIRRPSRTGISKVPRIIIGPFVPSICHGLLRPSL